jgi:ribosomal protein S17E
MKLILAFNNNYQQVDEWIPKESKSFRNEIKN